jgi:NADH-quinone oxidoreductase subunit E
MNTTEQRIDTDPALRKFDMVRTILKENSYDKERLIPILQAVQHEYRYLPEPAMIYIASALDISPARVFGVATFFAHFALMPKGKYIIKICDGTACHVKGSMGLYDTIKKVLALKGTASTTDDFLFTLETVSCLGACGLAPVLTINDAVYGQMTEEKVAALVDEFKRKETEK